jgi:hypothetical protein
VLLLQVAVAAAVIAVLAALLTRGTAALVGRFGGQTIHNLMSDAEYIVERRVVPPDWRTKLERKLRGLRPDGTDPRTQARHRERARRTCLRRLDRLITFARKSSVVADEETRGILVAELVEVDAEWRSRGWEGIAGSGLAGQ